MDAADDGVVGVVAPGRVTRTQHLPVQMKRDRAPAPSPAAPASASRHEDPFALHLLGQDACDVPVDKQGNTSPIEAELERLIEMAEWSKLRPAAFAAASSGAEARAKERREGDLPDLTGVGRVASLDRVARAMKSVQARWSTLSVDQRKRHIETPLDEELAAADIPPLEGIYHVPGKMHPASFDFRTWQIKLRTELLEGTALTDDAAADLCGVLAHEIRHAEQQYLTARVLAAEGRGVDAIVRTLDGLHRPIAVKAHAKKLAGLGGAEVAYAKRMHAALVTDRETNNILDSDTGYTRMAEARAEARTTLAALRERPPAATVEDARAACARLRERIDDVLLKYQIYRQLPAEADSHEVGAGAKAAFEELS